MTNLTQHEVRQGDARDLSESVTLGDLTASHLGEPMPDDELTPGEVARELGVSPATVRRWEERGVLSPSRRFPGSGHRRYSRASVEALRKLMADGDQGGSAQR